MPGRESSATRQRLQSNAEQRLRKEMIRLMDEAGRQTEAENS